jgi:tetratricopeptide (TPR) repeat protein
VFCPGDSLRVQHFGRAAITRPDETVVRLDQDTTVTFTQPSEQPRSWVEVLKGAVLIITRDHEALGVLTPFANAGIEGTEFLVVVTDEETTITVFEGKVAVSNSAGAVSVTTGQRGSARSGQMPLAQTVVRLRDAVQWTLYYDPVLDQALPEADQNPTAQQSRDPSFYIGRAARLLGVGRVDEAQADISRVLTIDPDNVDALALQSIAALTRNDKDEALRLANRATARDPQSAPALIALSYAQQAFFDISGALVTLQKAVRATPQNALAWARLSEMWLAVGDLDQGLTAAQTAVALKPSVARTQTVLGFAYLTQVDIARAMQAFEQATALDQSAPLPHLGRGLALIRTGELAAGRAEIETAVILDPGNALIRSYMGKAYYEEKRDALAASQLDIAKELDPLDPTAWYYDAIRKQTLNRPVEALHDAEQSVELNDNRAVYRSRLLLDEDLAARSASVGRIYRDLGFEQLALIGGWQSVAADDADYSGHRFLADVYSSLPRHEIARVNELYRSQLLQPLNITPIQPQLGEVNTFILDNNGPTELAFNEFNPLFNRNRVAVQFSAIDGSNGTRGDDVVVAGVHDKVSYSIGQFHFETDGFRENNDLDQDVYSAFIQYRPTYKTSLQAEIRSSDTDKGDLLLLFDPTTYNPDLRLTEHVNSLRLGARHAFSEQSVLLASLIYQDAALTAHAPPFLAVDTKLDGYDLDVQHLLRVGDWQLTSGFSRLDWNRDDTTTLPFPLPATATSTPIEQTTAYVYANRRFGEKANVLLGGSFDSLRGLTVDDQWFNPKLGLIWNVGRTTTLRLTAMRTVDGPTVSKQAVQPRLEPTQVAGFNQFFYSGAEGALAWRYGLGLDGAFSEKVHAGAELSRRDIDFPFIDFTSLPPAPTVVDVTEEIARAYLTWAAGTKLTFSATYQHERTDNSGTVLGQGFSELHTERWPLELEYHGPGGLTAGFTATHVTQNGTFQASSPPFLPIDAGDSFWVEDVSIGYRLKNRRGVVSLVVKNLTDEEFHFQDSDPENPGILPERVVLMRFTLAF